MKVKDLKANVKNPRKISEEDAKLLHESMERFGDLGCIVYNTRTGNLIGGHQRTKNLPAEASVHITEKYKEKSRTGTLAIGYIEYAGERFTYRAVDWDIAMETEAMLSANKHGGTWDNDLLRVAFATPSLRFEATGFKLPELSALNIKVKPFVPSKSLPVHSAPVRDVSSSKEETDEAYAKRTSNTGEERVPTVSEELSRGAQPAGGGAQAENKSAFDAVQEKMEIVGKRYMIIIDCRDEEHKASVKKSIKEPVEAQGGKFF